MIVEVIGINSSDVRNVCIREDWYTRGDNEAYSHMLGMCRQPYSVNLLESIAKDIYEHSDKDYWDCYDGNPVLNIMFTLRLDCCISSFEEV